MSKVLSCFLIFPFLDLMVSILVLQLQYHLSKGTFNFPFNFLPPPYNISFSFKSIISPHTHSDLCLLFWWCLASIWWFLAIDSCLKMRHHEVVWNGCVVKSELSPGGLQSGQALSHSVIRRHTPPPNCHYMWVFLWGNWIFPLTFHSGRQRDATEELGLSDKPGATVGGWRMTGAHRLASPRARDSGQFLQRRNSTFYRA